MRQPTQGKGREEIIQECKGNALYLDRKTPFHLSCSVVPLWCLNASCQLVAGNVNLSNLCQGNGTWILGKEPSALTSHSTACPGIGKIFGVGKVAKN